MSYDNLYQYLKEQIKNIPLSVSRPNASGFSHQRTNIYKTGKNKGKTHITKFGNKVQSMTLGDTTMRTKTRAEAEEQWGNNLQNRPINIKYKDLLIHLDTIAKEEFPDFKYSSITVNHNFLTLPHKDSQNVGESIIFGVGDYEGGELVVGEEKIDIKNKFFKFNGAKKEHYTFPFVGDRWSFVFYNL